MSEIEYEEVEPDPARTMEALRDTGYEFNTAIADIIDNSIAAGATEIDIKMNMDFRGQLRISIADNGCGMDKEGLKSAMKYGSPPRPSPKSLGKFGLGMKTASTAFCTVLMLTSKSKPEDELVRAIWDVQHVARVNQWELGFDKSDQETIDHFEEVAGNGTGTVLVWENIDRLLKDYSDPGGNHAQKALKKIEEKLGEHIGMVFQRFLDPEDKREDNVSITLNGSTIEAWDPFCKQYSELVAEEVIPVETEDGEVVEFSLKAYILPRKDEFPSDEEHKKAKLSNERQGIYIYRENRLIHDADWLGMASKEPHFSLIRVDFSFDHKLDEALHIDIKKSQIILDEAIIEVVRDRFLPAPRREANSRYRMRQNNAVTQKAKSSHDGSNSNIRAKEGEINSPKVTIVNPNTGEGTVENTKGTFKIKIADVAAAKPGEVYVQPVESLDDGLLYKPALIEGHNAVQINTSHPYYKKVYVPNYESGITIRGMDSLLWALCNAELSAWKEETQDHFEELRYELSHSLRKLVEDLPEPDVDIDEAA